MNEQPDYCDKCKSDIHVKVIDSRGSIRGRLRRYYCSKCHTRWSTNELKSSVHNKALSIKLKQIVEQVKLLKVL